MYHTTYKPNPLETATTEFDKSLNAYVNGFVHDERARLLEGLSGHAGLFSTAADLAKFIYSFLYDEKIMSNENKKLIYETVFERQSLLDNKIVRTYGFD